MSEQDLHYLNSIMRQLCALRTELHGINGGVSLGLEALSDNIDWLDCFIDRSKSKGD